MEGASASCSVCGCRLACVCCMFQKTFIFRYFYLRKKQSLVFFSPPLGKTLSSEGHMYSPSFQSRFQENDGGWGGVGE